MAQSRASLSQFPNRFSPTNSGTLEKEDEYNNKKDCHVLPLRNVVKKISMVTQHDDR
jgi:hypothetical protein